MAKGKLSPRQKMINLMYLVFIAMMAMQIDREVLRSFEGVNKSLNDASALTAENNATFYDQINKKAAEDPDYQAIKGQANQVKEASNTMYNYIEGLKNDLTTATEYTPPAEGEETNYNSLSNTDAVTNLFFKGDKTTEKGEGLQSAMDQYREFLLKQYSSESDKKRVHQLFDTPDYKNRSWVNKTFYNQPMVAALTNMTKIQSDVRTEEGNLVRTLLANKLQDELELKAFQPIVDVPPVVRMGDKLIANIAFGAYDNTLQGNVDLGGREIPLTDGKATFDLPTGSVGVKTIKGTMSYKKPDGSMETMPFEKTYNVVSETLEQPPAGGAIMADKMNVVYRGVSNPLTAAVNGIDGPISMTASASGLSGSNGKYTFRPGAGNSVTFTASGKTSSGKVVTVKREFRIKPVPPPQGQIRGKNALTVSVNDLSKLSVTAAIPDFEFPVTFNVTGFSVKVPGQRAMKVSGNRLNAASAILSKAKPGDAVTVFDIQATATGMSGAVRSISPVALDVK